MPFGAPQASEQNHLLKGFQCRASPAHGGCRYFEPAVSALPSPMPVCQSTVTLRVHEVFRPISRRARPPWAGEPSVPRSQAQAPNKSLEPTWPAGGRVLRDTSLGWPGGSAPIRSAPHRHLSRTISSRDFNGGRRPPAVGAAASNPQFPHSLHRGPPANQLSPTGSTRSLGRSQRGHVARAPGPSQPRARVLAPNKSLEPTWPAECLALARY